MERTEWNKEGMNGRRTKEGGRRGKQRIEESRKGWKEEEVREEKK